MRYDKIHCIVIGQQIPVAFSHFLFRWQFLLPPAQMINAIISSFPVQSSPFQLEVRVVRFQYAAFHVMAACSSKGKYFFTVNHKNLASHQMDNRRPDFVNIASMPFFYRISI